MRTSREDVIELLRAEGAADQDAERIVRALAEARLSAPQMRAWLAHPLRAYSVSVGAIILGVDFKQVPTHAIESGHVDAVIAAAEHFAAASPDERLLSRTFLCELDAVARLTHGDAERTSKLVQVAEMLRTRLRKDVAVFDALVAPVSDDDRLVDWLADERLDLALSMLTDGQLDPAALRERAPRLGISW